MYKTNDTDSSTKTKDTDPSTKTKDTTYTYHTNMYIYQGVVGRETRDSIGK
jgi:hypothetical protein